MNKDLLRKLYRTNAISNIINLLGRPWRGCGAILVYHRVLPDRLIEQDLGVGLAVTESNFDKQIKFLKEKYDLVSIDNFIEKLNDKNKKKFFLTITFDDGYKDNLNFALPILEKYKVPSTIYYTTKFLDQHVSLWWYELKEIINKNSSLDFTYKNEKFSFKLNDENLKKIAFNSVRKIFLKLKSNDQIKLLELISNSKNRKNYSNLCLDKKDLEQLSNNTLITIGAHTHDHLNLKILNEKEAISDISKSAEIIESIIKKKVKHFAYPYGGIEQAGKREYDIIKNLNFKSGVTSVAYPVNSNKLFSLPRINVAKNANEKEIQNHLSGFYNLAYKFL